MTSLPRKRIVVAGGGTAGWMAALALSRQLGPLIDITLVESDAIGTVGVGEATIPPLQTFHKMMRVDEPEFMRATSATFKLGISFEGWGAQGERYLHAFGRNGKSTWLGDFHHFWLRGRAGGLDADLGAFCYEAQAAEAGRFARASAASTDAPEISYAYHFDATAYAAFLRRLCEAAGVVRREGLIAQVRQHADTGHIDALVLSSGEVIEGDIFIDCTGFAALLIGGALQVSYDDWAHWLPCDRALAVQTPTICPPIPYTRSIAHRAGWQWRIPLQHRVGNGIVYNSEAMTDDEAERTLRETVAGELMSEPRRLRFRTGRRRTAWAGNCLSLGLASGFLEPLESTSIHLVMTGIVRFIQLFPFHGIDPAAVAQFNDQSRIEMERIRDFLILHYHLNRRTDSPFWERCRTMAIPDTLASRMAIFRANAHAFQIEGELFRVDSWVQVMIGQGLTPDHHHPLADVTDSRQLAAFLEDLRRSIARSVERLPAHHDFVARYCGAGMP